MVINLRIWAFRMFQHDHAAPIVVKGALPEATGFRKERAYKNKQAFSFCKEKKAMNNPGIKLYM